MISYHRPHNKSYVLHLVVLAKDALSFFYIFLPIFYVLHYKYVKILTWFTLSETLLQIFFIKKIKIKIPLIKNQLPKNWIILQKMFEKNLKGVSLFNLNYFIIYHNYLILHQNTFHSVTWSNFLNYIFIVQFQLCVCVYIYVCMYLNSHNIFLLICT